MTGRRPLHKRVLFHIVLFTTVNRRAVLRIVRALFCQSLVFMPYEQVVQDDDDQVAQDDDWNEPSRDEERRDGLGFPKPDRNHARWSSKQ